MFVDASAWTAVILREPERERLRDVLADADIILTSPIANWETVRAILREAKDTMKEASARLTLLQARIGVRLVEIGPAEGEIALEAHARFAEHGRLFRLCLRKGSRRAAALQGRRFRPHRYRGGLV
jgi:ribonuclease VapC